MVKAFKDIAREAAALPEQERATLAGLLIDSLDTEIEDDAAAAWDAEIARRVADLDAGRATTEPWDAVRQRLVDRLNAR